MSHWAEIDDNNIVLRVTVGDNDDPNGDEGYQWLIDNLGGRWIQTSYNANFRGKFAGIGYTYDPVNDVFVAPTEQEYTISGRDITDDIPLDIGQPTLPSNIWFNTDTAFDVAIGGQPFIYATSEERPYERATAPYRKQQFDNSQEPGEQSLTGWWIRSQSSFHRGEGIKFFDPSAGEEIEHRFETSKGVNVWTPGEVTLLRDVTESEETTGEINDNGVAQQHLRSIEWTETTTSSVTVYEGVLLLDKDVVHKIDSDEVVTEFVEASTSSSIFSICDDGTNAFWITNAATSKEVYKKPLVGTSADTSDVVQMFDEVGTITNAVIEYVKNRIVLAADNKVHEFSTAATSLPAAVYTNPATNHVYTSISASGTAIYLAGYNGIQSIIEKFVLASNGAMPVLASAITAAELPTGEIVQAIHYYLGYMLIGTSKGIRVAQVSDDGSLTYGPLIVETTQPVFAFATRDRFAWATTGVNGAPGLIRIDLSEQISPLVFAYANDVYEPDVSNKITTAASFIGNTDRVAFCAAEDHSYLEKPTDLVETGFIQTGRIRYATLEPKNYKRLVAKADVTKGSITLNTVDVNNLVYDIITYNDEVGTPEVTTAVPQGPLEFLQYKFDLIRDTDVTKGPILKGYQIKSLPASTRQRLVQLPLFCFDVEQDRFNNEVGYQGRAFERIVVLETLEETGDEVTFQDFTTGEQFGCVIEEVSFRKISPPDRRFSGFGGILNVVIRKL